MEREIPSQLRVRTALPQALAHLERDSRGYPVTYVTALKPDGVPDFTQLDGERRLECIRDNLCGLCGTPLSYWRAVIGGPTVIRTRLSLDPPMHMDCAGFAATSSTGGCPFLLHLGTARYSKSADTAESPRPERLYFATTRSHALVRTGLDAAALCAPFKSTWEIRYGQLGSYPAGKI